MIKREIFIGFAVGLLCNALGALLAILLLSKYSIAESWAAAKQEGHLGSLLALGALLNLLAFFLFLKMKMDYRARGVIIATMITGIYIVIYKLL